MLSLPIPHTYPNPAKPLCKQRAGLSTLQRGVTVGCSVRATVSNPPGSPELSLSNSSLPLSQRASRSLDQHVPILRKSLCADDTIYPALIDIALIETVFGGDRTN